MIGRKTFLAVVALAAATGVAAADDFPFDKFEPARLADVTAHWEEAAADGPQGKPGSLVIIGAPDRDIFHVVYTGVQRPLDAPAKDYVGKFGRGVGASDEAIATYQAEYLFREDGKDYWLPVQAPVAAFFTKELKPGDAVDLYALTAGGYLTETGWQWIALVEEYRKPTPPAKGG
jgi:hypothetical protein